MASLMWDAYRLGDEYATVTVDYTENIYSTHSTITVNDIRYYNSYTSDSNSVGAPIYWQGLTLQISGSFGTHTVVSGMHFGSGSNASNETAMNATTPNIAAGSSSVKFILSGTLTPHWDWGTLDRKPLTIGSSPGSSATTQSVSITYVPISYKLSISAGANSSITVKRTNSPLASAATGTLSNGSTIYERDTLQVTFSASTGYNLTTHTVNGTSFTSGGSHTVSSNVSVVSATTLKSYKLSISAGTGSTITVTKGGTKLSNNATIYHFDQLSISFSANTGYNAGALTVNGAARASGYVHQVSGDVTVQSTASLKSYKLIISPGTGSTITVTKGGAALSNGATIYHFDELKLTTTSSAEYEILTQTVNSKSFTNGYVHKVDENVTVATTTRILGIIYIDNGTTFEKYMIFIDNGTGWDQYIPYIDNGTKFVQYS